LLAKYDNLGMSRMSPSRVAPPIPNRLEMPLTGGTLLRVDFDRAGDRWRHRVALVLPEGSSVVSPVLLLESQEGSSDEDWPASPPLQAISIEERPRKLPSALLLGMAGSSHWSAAIEQHPAEKKLRFDIACRTTERPANLGSRYRLAPRVDVMHVDDAGCRLRFLAAGIAFELGGEQNKDSPLPAMGLSERDLSIYYGEPTVDKPRTYRWVYCLTAVEA
jgi:hypothetical protein